jgi:hypothetical protein
MMKEVGGKFGFKTIDFQGRTWTHRAMIGQILGYNTESGIRFLTEKYQLMTSEIGCFAVELRNRAREIFNLSPKDGHAVFVTWDTILVCGMCGRGEKADRIKMYLLEAERAFRIGVGGEKEESTRLKAIKDEIMLIDRVGKMKDGYYKLAAIEALERLSGKPYDKPKQDLLNFLAPKPAATE